MTSDASWSSTIHLKRRFRKKVSIDLDWIRSIFAEIQHEEYTFENDQKPVYDLVHGEGIIMQEYAGYMNWYRYLSAAQRHTAN